MPAPKDFDPMIWGIVSVLLIGALVWIAQFMPNRPFPNPAAAVGSAFAWGFGICLVTNNVRHWLWKRSSSRLR